MRDRLHEKLLAHSNVSWVEESVQYAFSKEDDEYLESLAESIEDSEYYTESGKEGILKKIMNLFHTLQEKITSSLMKKADKNTDPNAPVPADKKQFNLLQKFIQTCKKIITLPLRVLNKMIHHPMKTGVAVILAFSGISLYKSYKKDNPPAAGEIVTRKQCKDLLNECGDVCRYANDKIANFLRTDAKDAADKLADVLQDKRARKAFIDTSQQKLRDEARMLADRVEAGANTLTSEATKFFSHLAKSIQGASMELQKVLIAKV